MTPRKHKSLVDTLFIFLTLLSIVLEMTFLFVSKEKNWRSLIWNGDTVGIFPDLFESIGAAMGKTPYDQHSIYPAFAYMLCYLLGLLIPNFNPKMWPDESLTREAVVVEFWFYTICFFLLFLLICKYLNKQRKQQIVLFLFFIFSAPCIYMIERGNLVIVSMLLVFFFLMEYDSDSAILRHFSYICLAAASAMKIYPAVLGLLVLNTKRKGDVKYLLLYGIILFIFPFAFFQGIRGIKLMLINAFSLSNETAVDTRNFGYGFKVNIQNLFSAISEYVNYTEHNGLSAIIFMGEAFLLIISGLINAEKWKKASSYILFVILIPTFSWIYNVVYLLPVFVLFLNNNGLKRREDIVYLILFLFSFTSFPCRQILKSLEGANKMTISTVICSTSMLIMSIMLFFDGISYKLWGGEKIIYE